jgi:tetratricopeptide (TPR) repeat protein
MVQILRVAMRGWESLTGKKAPDLRPPGAAALQALRRNTDRNPVFLQLAAIRACETGSTLHIAEWSQGDLLQYAVSRERAYLRGGLGARGNPEAVERAVAFLSLAGARTPDDKGFAALLAADAEALGLGRSAAPATLKGLAAVVGKKGETERRIFVPIAHDLVSGAFAATVLGERRPLLDETISRVLDVQPDVGWLNLLRITGDLCGIPGFDLTRSWLDLVLAERPVEELEWLSSQLAVRTPQLAAFGAALQETLVLRMPQTPEYVPLRAETMNRLAVCNAELGRRTAALETARRAAEAFEKIAAENSSWRSAWSDSLNNLAVFQTMVGQHAAAADTGRRVVELREELAKEDPARHRARLAGAWGNLGICLVESGDGEEGLAAVKRAASIWEELARENPDAFGPGFAQILNNLGALNGRRRKWRDALAPCERAVGYLRGLADRNPDVFEPELAAALTNLSNALAGMGRAEPAMRESSEAVFLFEKLSHRNPDAWENDLALALVNLAAHCRRAGKAAEAALHARAALDICERRAGRDRRIGGNLAAALANLGAAADPRSQADQALMAAGKAVEVYEGLFKGQPEAYRAELGAALLLHGRLQSDMGLKEPGLQSVTRAMEFLTYLAEKDPQSHEAVLAGAYGVLARVLQLSGDGEKARGAYRKGIEVLQRGFDRDPSANAEIAATLIQGYVKHCDAAGKRPSPEALAPYEEALRRMAAKGGGGARA